MSVVYKPPSLWYLLQQPKRTDIGIHYLKPMTLTNPKSPSSSQFCDSVMGKQAECFPASGTVCLHRKGKQPNCVLQSETGCWTFIVLAPSCLSLPSGNLCSHSLMMHFETSLFHVLPISTFQPSDQSDWLPHGHMAQIPPTTAKDIQFPGLCCYQGSILPFPVGIK